MHMTVPVRAFLSAERWRGVMLLSWPSAFCAQLYGWSRRAFARPAASALASGMAAATGWREEPVIGEVWR